MISETHMPSSHLKGETSEQVSRVPHYLLLLTQVPSPEQNLNPLGQVKFTGQFCTDCLHDPSMHFTGLSIGHTTYEGQSSKAALHEPSLKQWNGKAKLSEQVDTMVS